MTFPCRQCGACCERTAQMSDEFLRLVGIERGPKGWCKHLIDDRCAVYEDRPAACRIREENYPVNAAVCNVFLREKGRTDLITEAEIRRG